MKNLDVKLFILLLITFFLSVSITQVEAQTYSIKGKVADSTDMTPLPGATILLVNISDTTIIFGTTTSSNGYFQFAKLAPSHYRLKISFISYNTFKQSINVNNSDVILPPIKLNKINTQLKEVTVTTNQIRVEQKGDTLLYNANAYKTNPDATAEDLIKRMPGITSDGTTVKVNGEEVKKVLVDGKVFFGDDPSATLKNFPAEMVGEVQVFDKSSDHVQFTGFKDGDEQKTLNIVTKGGEKSEGKFGKFYAGYGTDERYNAGLTFNSFNDNRRISIIGISNNINQQNFSIADIMSVMSNSSAQSGGPPGPNSPMANFFSGQQSGNTKTTAIGLNYIDNWGKKINVSGSYFFNQTDNTNSSSSLRNYYTDNKLIYDQSSIAKTENLNHRINFKFEYAIDSANAIKISPSVTFQTNNSNINSSNKLSGSNAFLSKTINDNNFKNTGYNFQNDLLFQHKFSKKGRTISFNINTQLNNRDGTGDYYSSSFYNDTATISTIIHQEYKNYNNGTTWGGNISYTEPIGKNGQIIATYRPAQTKNDAVKSTYNLALNENNNLDSTLSNKYGSTYTTQRGGISYRISNQKLNFSAGADLQQSEFEIKQIFPYSSSINNAFINTFPTALFNYKFSKTKNLNVIYRTQTKTPTNTQLQDVIDVSNPLLVKSGNSKLIPSYENNLIMRLGFTNNDRTRNFFIFLMGKQTNNYIGNSTVLINNDTLIRGYTISRGSQLTILENLNNYYNLKTFSVYSFPLTKIKSNLNLNIGYTLSHIPALINNSVNYSSNKAVNGGINLSSNISQYLDFSLAYDGSYNTVLNTMETQSNSNYYNHTATLKVNYILLKKIVLNTDVNQITYSGLSQNYNQNYILWNAYIGYKFLKNQSLEAKISVYDLMNQNRSISRTITETYSEDSNTEILKRYLMVTLTYTFKKFKNANAQDYEHNDFPKDMPPPPK